MKENEQAREDWVMYSSRCKALIEMLDEFERGCDTFDWGWSVLVDESEKMFEALKKAGI